MNGALTQKMESLTHKRAAYPAFIRGFRARQQGALTMMTAVLVLLVMTLMIFYSARTGLFEQRTSGNEASSKLAFHAAEAGIDHAIEFLLANTAMINSASEDVRTDGTDGWLSTAGQRWHKCSEHTADYDDETSATEIAHPCRGESSDARRSASYFYFFDDPDQTGEDQYAIQMDSNRFLGDGQRVDVYALLCRMVIDNSAAVPFSRCAYHDESGMGGLDKVMVTLLARGSSDCFENPDSGALSCRGQALVVEPVSNFSALNGPPPSVPLTARSTMPDSGSSTILTNPNAGGMGVPISVWAASQNACPNDPTLQLSTGNFETCHAHEFYDSDVEPAIPLAVGSNASCAEGPLTYTSQGSVIEGYDMFWDAAFPCDVFEYYFGIPRSSYNIIKNQSMVIGPSGCGDLTENSSGMIWVTPKNADGSTATCDLGGSKCSWQANDLCVGSAENPVVIVTTANTNMNGKTRISGIVFITDAEDGWPGDNVKPNLSIKGGAMVHGAMVIDLPKVVGNPNNFTFNGNFKLIYGASNIVKAHGAGNIGALMGGWTDFPKCWYAHQAGCP